MSSTKTKSDLPEGTRWWIKLLVKPFLLLAAGAFVIFSLGMAQKVGWISAGGGGEQVASSIDTRPYICPMLCTPPLVGPGRCPVCKMELVLAASGGDSTDSRSIQIDPAARRVANIQTVAVRSVSLMQSIRAIGEIGYDEGSLKTISAYVDGRLDRLFADFTGVAVEQGDQLALVYSPRLYSSQVELLLAKKARDKSQKSSLQRVVQSNRDMYESTKQRLIELGMTQDQIEQLERVGKASSRVHLIAPISGTVIEKYSTEGEYVKEGQAIYKLADLSTVWLMLELFPEDAAAIHYGQKVEAEMQSLPGRKFTGRVAFVDPMVDPGKRTVGVRVVMPNENSLLRIGDYAKATIQVPLSGDETQRDIYDSELANKWISPRHPHVVESSPGKCRVCGIDLVPASRYGFADQPFASGEVLVVPRSAVLMAGSASVLYVEVESGRFELRNIVLGARSGDQVVVLQGLEVGEQVAVSGNFLIDSQMQLAGNPSLIDPTKVKPSPASGEESVLSEISTELSPEDLKLVEQQEICPVSDQLLGSMGTPIKILVGGQPVFICCDGCREPLLAEPDKFLAKLRKEKSQ